MHWNFGASNIHSHKKKGSLKRLGATKSSMVCEKKDPSKQLGATEFSIPFFLFRCHLNSRFFWGWLNRKQGRVIVASRCFARFAMKFATQRIGDQASTNCESPFRVTSKVANCAMSLLNQNRFGWQRRSNGDFGTLSKMTSSVLWMLWWGLRMVCRFKRRIGFTTATTPIPFFQVWANPSPAAWVLSCSVPLWLKQGFQTQRQRPAC